MCELHRWGGMVGSSTLLIKEKSPRNTAPTQGDERKAYKAGYTYPIGTRINVFSQYNFGDSNNSGVENLKQNSLT